MLNESVKEMDLSTKISIITCSYQQASFLEYSIRSVLEQEYSNTEYLVIDGASSDGSVEIIERYADRLAYFVSEKDDGQSQALNKGLMHSTGQILGWLCSDDLLLPGALQAVAAYFETHPEVDAVYGDAILIDESGTVVCPKREMGFSPMTILHDYNYIPQPSMFWRRALMDRVGLLDENLHLSMDADYWLRFAQIGKVMHVSEFWSCMRLHGAQKVFVNRPGVYREANLLRQRHAKDLNLNGPRWFFWWYARLYRVLIRFLSNGYNRSSPDGIRDWLSSLHATASPGSVTLSKKASR